ncbi:MAG: class I SAM-dependent methyltransferase [Deltaproteobacteria bacterium]|nr:class I SAM-dependent methyltransferase [Deltaproteobacteria bacterium]MBM4322066.1 class I SAM-dependent methyltransferase [Deltaproteobacteria bacterium]MBM4346511.1 class I SAM-dependent methyltransferase [Deltaproteobacteria bacterium]
MQNKLFDQWPEDYDRWFTTPLGFLVKKYESNLLLELLKPNPGEKILDAGCGTGIFTSDFLSHGCHVIGIDISSPMLVRAKAKMERFLFQTVQSDILRLPFKNGLFNKTISVTAIEFIEDAKAAIEELFRVTQRGGTIVVASLNSLSPWAERRKSKKDHSLFQKAIFRSPDELLSLVPIQGIAKTAVYFRKEDDPEKAQEIERAGREMGLNTGAFVAARWEKP